MPIVLNTFNFLAISILVPTPSVQVTSSGLAILEGSLLTAEKEPIPDNTSGLEVF